MTGETPSLFADLSDQPAPAAAPPDHAERRLIEQALDTTMLVEAAAGTGKTTSMVRRMLEGIASGACAIDGIAAVTFTRKSTAELRARFQVALEHASRDETGERRERLQHALAHVEQCFIGTIHSFCGRLLRERPIEAGVDVAFDELDEDQEFRLRMSVWEEHIAELFARDAPILAELDELGLDLRELGDAWREFAEYPDVPEWPTEAIDADPDAERSAAAALRDYCRHMEAVAPTLEGVEKPDALMELFGDLPRRLRHVALGRSRELIDLLETCAAVGPDKVKVTRWPGGKTRGHAERDRWATFLQTHATPLIEGRRWRRHRPIMQVLADAQRLYDRTRAIRGELNYQDLLMRAADLLRDKPHIRRYFRRRFTHLLVDEFQDTDPVQAEVMLLLTADDVAERDWTRCRPVDGSLFVVGDPKQSIYRFRRADIVTYDCVRSIIQSCGRVVPLTANFRSVAPIITWVNGVSASLFTEPSRYAPADSPMQAARPGAIDDAEVGVRVMEVPKGLSGAEAIEHEAETVARAIRDAIDRGMRVPRTPDEIAEGRPLGATPGDFLILTRTRQPLIAFAERLQAYGLPVEVTGGTAVNEIDEVALLHTVLAAVVQPEDPVALVGCLRSAIFGISDTDLYRFTRGGGRLAFSSAAAAGEVAGGETVADALRRLARYAGWMESMQPLAAIERIAADLGLLARSITGPGGFDRGGGLCKAIELLRTAQRTHWNPCSLVRYLWDLVDHENRQRERHDGVPLRPHDEPAIRIMNLHKAKGLEAPIVYLVQGSGRKREGASLHVDRSTGDVRGYLQILGPQRGWSRPTLATHPSWDAFEQEEQRFLDAEEDRLLYVAATRAGAQLTISVPEGSSRRWEKLAADLGPDAIMEAPPPPAPVTPVTERLDDDAPHVVADEIATRWSALRRPTYAVGTAKTLSVTGRLPAETAGEHGTEWGTAIHLVLEAAMHDRAADLESIAAAALSESGLEPSLAATAARLVEGVIASDVWRRAEAGRPRLTEVPIQFLEPGADGAPEMVVRGVIDLLFREEGGERGTGWVIVDYKTDDTPGRELDDLVSHYAGQLRMYARAWAALVDEPVVEAGLQFIQTGAYRTVELPGSSSPAPLT